MNAQKNKGDRAEREACIYLTAATGHIVERRFGAGQDKDKGDLVGIPNTCIQVTDMKNPVMIYIWNRSTTHHHLLAVYCIHFYYQSQPMNPF